MRYNADGVSVTNPKAYASRFRSFLCSKILPDNAEILSHAAVEHEIEHDDDVPVDDSEEEESGDGYSSYEGDSYDADDYESDQDIHPHHHHHHHHHHHANDDDDAAANGGNVESVDRRESNEREGSASRRRKQRPTVCFIGFFFTRFNFFLVS